MYGAQPAAAASLAGCLKTTEPPHRAGSGGPIRGYLCQRLTSRLAGRGLGALSMVCEPVERDPRSTSAGSWNGPVGRVFAYSAAPATHRLVLLAIAHHEHERLGIAWPSMARLADLTGLNRRTVQRAIADLLMVIRKNGRRTNRYLVTLTAGEALVQHPVDDAVDALDAGGGPGSLEGGPESLQFGRHTTALNYERGSEQDRDRRISEEAQMAAAQGLVAARQALGRR